jgi:hypothetical protein
MGGDRETIRIGDNLIFDARTDPEPHWSDADPASLRLWFGEVSRFFSVVDVTNKCSPMMFVQVRWYHQLPKRQQIVHGRKMYRKAAAPDTGIHLDLNLMIRKVLMVPISSSNGNLLGYMASVYSKNGIRLNETS